MNYTKPNPKREWPEALRYRIFERMGYDAWVKLVKKGKPINFSEINTLTGNIDLDYENLEVEKKERFEKAFEMGEIEMPIVARFKKYKFDLVGGNTRIAGLISKGHNPKVWVIDVRDIDNQGSSELEVKETGADSAGSFEGPAFGKSTVIKRPISKIPNMNIKEEAELKEVTAGDAGQYDVPLFGTSPKGRRNPLKIDGPKSIYKGRAVKDKNFPKWGGPDSVFVKVKEKCKKFPYCNQGNTGALEFIHEDEELQEAIRQVSKKYGIPHKEVENIVLNEIKDIFI